jgi:hypothetical protein
MPRKEQRRPLPSVDTVSSTGLYVPVLFYSTLPSFQVGTEVMLVDVLSSLFWTSGPFVFFPL